MSLNNCTTKDINPTIVKATIAAKKQLDVSEIKMRQKILEKESEQKVAKLQDEIQSSHQKASSDSEYYRIMRESEANNKRLTPEFIEYTRIVSMSNNTKVYFGNKIPNMLQTNAVPSTTSRL